MNHRILILGSLDEFVPLVRMARERGIYTVDCDGYPEGPAKTFADRAYTVPVTEIDQIAQICKTEQADGILTAYSDLLLECMVKIADRAGLPCYLSPDQLEVYRNKASMKQMFQRLGIGTPKFTRLYEDFEDRQLEGFRFPVIAKPIDKFGSRGIFVLNTIKEIRSRFQDVCQTSEIKQILIEEYNTGFEFNMMCWVREGHLHVLSIADREKTAVEGWSIPISTRNVYPSRLMSYVYEDAKSILEKVIAFTGQKNGELSMQFFWKPSEGIQVCEIAARFLGYEHELIEYSSGFSIEKLLLDSIYDPDSLEKDLAGHNPWFQTTSAVLYFQGKEKTISDLSKARDIARLPYVKSSWLFYEEGETIQHYVRPYAARCCITGPTREVVDEETQYIFDHISFTGEGGEELLYSNQITDYHL